MRRKVVGTLTLSEEEQKKVRIMADWAGLSPWLSQAALVRGLLYKLWRDVYSWELTPEERQKWQDATVEEEKVGRMTGYGYSRHFS